LNDKLLTILVTGANSQLGNELHVIAQQFPYCQFLFVTKAELDITNFNSLIIALIVLRILLLIKQKRMRTRLI